MTAVFPVLAGIMGALIGSFLNVVIHRMPLGESMGFSRSKCPGCGATIRWFDNIPLLSFLVLRGRCRACGWRIPLRYPVVEAATSALFVLAAMRTRDFGWEPWPLAFGVSAAFSALLVAASFIDMAHKILPDKLTLRAGPIIALIGALGVPAIHGTVLFGHELGGSIKPGLASLLVGLAGAVVGGGIILSIRQLGSWLLKKEAMGLGDVKFMAMAGLLLGPGPVVFAIATAMVGGSVLGVVIWAITKNREIPFGPFLAAGCLAVLFYGGAIDHFVFEVYVPWARGEG